MALPLLIAGGVAAVAALATGARAGLEWAAGESTAAELAYQTWWPWAEQPSITPPDLLPAAPTVAQWEGEVVPWSPESTTLYTAERRLRDIAAARQAATGDEQEPKPSSELPWWVLPAAIGLGALLVLRR